MGAKVKRVLVQNMRFLVRNEFLPLPAPCQGASNKRNYIFIFVLQYGQAVFCIKMS